MPVPLVIPSSSSAAGTARYVIRHRLAAELGYFALGTVTTEAASLEGDRWVISESLLSDQAPPEHLDGLYLYVRDGDEGTSQRKVLNGAFDGALGAGFVDAAYATGPLAEGTQFEISVLPAEPYLGASGLNTIINLALEQLTVIDYLPLTIVEDDDGATQTEYLLTGYTWPIKAVQTVVYPRTSTTAERRREMPRGYWTFEDDAEGPVLSFLSLPANVGDVIEVKFLRPATTRIRQAGVWGDVTTGLVSDSDECLYDATTVVREASPIAKDRLALLQERGSKAWSSLKGEAADERVSAAVARLYGRRRGNGAQRIGAIGGR